VDDLPASTIPAAPPRWTDYVHLDDVTRAGLNPKDHDLEVVKRSIRRFGFVDSAVHDGRTDRIIAGHGRLESLQAMHAAGEPAPDGILRHEDGGWMMPVQMGWASRSDEEAAALLVVLNKATELGGWVEDELSDLLQGLRAHDDGDQLLQLSGFTIAEADALLAKLNPEPPTFDPVDDGTRLDQKKPTCCPSCGFQWRFGPRGQVEPV
jgi:hypothetical protein